MFLPPNVKWRKVFFPKPSYYQTTTIWNLHFSIINYYNISIYTDRELYYILPMLKDQYMNGLEDFTFIVNQKKQILFAVILKTANE